MEPKCASDVMSLVFWRERGKRSSDLQSPFCNRASPLPHRIRLAALKQKVVKFAQKEEINELGKKKKEKCLEGGEKKDEKNLSPGIFFFLSQVNYHFQGIIFFKIVGKKITK